MSKFTWEQMELCKDCHYKDMDPDICRFKGEEVKPGAVMNNYNCGRYERESHWQRRNKAEEEMRLIHGNN